MSTGPGPLWRRAPLRGLTQGAWSVVLVGAFLLAALAGAADVLSVAGWRTAATDRVLDAVPEGAVVRLAPDLRVGAAPAPGPELDRLLQQVDDVPGLGAPELLGVSFRDELDGGTEVRYESFAAGASTRVPARLVAVDDPAAVLTGGARGQDGAAAPSAGLWLPEQVAAGLGLGPGDTVDVGLAPSTGSEPEQVTQAEVAGTYRVSVDGTTPDDVPGASFWADRSGRLPGDVGGGSSVALLVGPPAEVLQVARASGDVLLWNVDAGLRPARPTRDQLGATAAGVARLQQGVARAGLRGFGDEVVTTVVSGVGGLAEQADDIARRTAAEARAPVLGSIGLSLAVLAAVSVLTAARRSRELGLLAGLGVRPPAVAALGVVEVLPAAALGLALALPVSVAGAGLLTGVPVEGWAVRRAAEQAAVLLLVGVAVHGLVTLLAAAAAARSGARHERRAVAVPWRPVLVVSAVAAVVGLVAAPAGGARGLDLAVPVLVCAAVGAVGASGLRLLAAGRRSAPADDGGPLAPGAVGRLVLRRRLGSGGAERLLVVTALAAAFGLAVHVLAGGALAERSVQDKAAVVAGAQVLVELDLARQVDPSLPFTGWPADPDVSDGDSVVYRGSGRLPGGSVVDVVAVDPTSIGDVASWGSEGGPLQRGREALAVLGAADAHAAPRCPSASPREALFGAEEPEPGAPEPPPCPPTPDPAAGVPLGAVAPGPAPVLLVGDPVGLRVGQTTTVTATNAQVAVEVVGRVPAFPGLDPDLRTGLVAATGSFLPRLPNGDPRLAAGTALEIPNLEVESVELWSSRSLADVQADLRGRGVDDATLTDERRTRTLEAALVRPAFVAVALVAPYLVALSVLVLLMAVLALALSVDRAAARSRAGDVVLARIGLGARGPRRLLLAEAALLVGAGLGLGLLGWAATLPLLPRLVEPEPAVAPPVDVAGVLLVADQVLPPVLAAVALALGVGAVVAWAGSRQRAEEEVLRGLD
ncbi:hypothetical protein [Jannaschia sp. R86511]|uniref:hypothetical protein n=1 Tax=Jannaschia sp. R86511 TaxID=3093853 RepID=UPI0036D21FEE